MKFHYEIMKQNFSLLTSDRIIVMSYIDVGMCWELNDGAVRTDKVRCYDKCQLHHHSSITTKMFKKNASHAYATSKMLKQL